MADILKIAIQKSGRLNEGSVSLLKKCDIAFDNGGAKLRAAAENFPVEVLFLRDDDIPQYVEDGVADAGVVGLNTIEENGAMVDIIERLGFGRCRLSIAVPRDYEYSDLATLDGKRIATSYPRLLERHLREHGVRVEIHSISGSVEIAPSIGVADAICDLVSSGSTLFTNGLREVETVMESEAVLVSRKSLSPEKQSILNKLMFRIRAVSSAGRNRYILLNSPNDRLSAITSLLPGIKSPTVMPLSEPGWSSVHSVIGEREFWNVVEKLRDAGAEGILVIRIDQMIE